MSVRQDKVQISIEFITDESKAFAKTLIDTKEMNKQLAESRAKLAQYNKQLLAVGNDEVKRAEILAKIAVEENKVEGVLKQIAAEARKVAAIDLTKLTPAQLTERARQLAAAMRDIPASAPQFKELEAELARVNAQLGQLRANAKGIQVDSPAESGGGFFGTVTGRVTVAIAAVQAFFATVQGLFNFVRTAVSDFNAVQQADAALRSRIESTGGAAQRSFEQLREQADTLERTTLFTAEETIKGQELLLTFTNIRGEIFDRTIPAVQDLSTVFGQDLQSSAVQLGKALNDPVQGITALRRVGISFTDEQQKTIQTLVETNRVAEAQTLILEELERQVGGAAQAAGAAGTGPLTILENRLGAVKDGIGELIVNGLHRLQPTFEVVVTVLEKVVGAMQSGEKATGEYAGTANTIIGILQTLAVVVQGVSAVFGVLYDVVLRPLGFLLTNVIVPAFIGLGLALAALPRFISENRVAIGGLIVGLVTLNAQAILAAANSLRMAVASTAATIATNAQTVAQRLLNAAMTANPIGLVITALSALVAAFSVAYNSSEGFRSTMDGLGRVATEVFRIIIEGAGAIARGFSQLLDGEFAEAGKSFIEGINKINPIGIAFTQGERLGKAYSEGYASGVEKAPTPPDPRDLAEQARDDRQKTFSPARPQAPNGGDFNIGGETLEDVKKRREKEFDLQIKQIQIDQQRRELVLESFRIKEEISEERFQEGMSKVRENSLKKQLSTYVAFGRAQENEALKIKNALLEIEQARLVRSAEPLAPLPTRPLGQVKSEDNTDEELQHIQNQALAEEAILHTKFQNLLGAELQYEIDKEAIRSEGYARQLALLEANGKAETDEYKRIAEQKKDADKSVADNKERLAGFMRDIEEAEKGALKASFDFAIEMLTRDEKERKKYAAAIKAFKIGEVITSGIMEVQRINAKYALIPGGTLLAQAEVIPAIIRTTVAVAKIATQKFERGKLVDFGGDGRSLGRIGLKMFNEALQAKIGFFGGKPHSAGGTKGYFEDGTVVEVEKDEAWAVVNKRNAPLLRMLSYINSLGGNGKPYFKDGGLLKFEMGGIPFANTTPNISPASIAPAGGSAQDEGLVRRMEAAAATMLEAAKAFPKRVKADVVYQDVEEAGDLLNAVRDDAAI